MLASVIVITYHRNQFLQSTIASIYSQQGMGEPFEVIVIDNGGNATPPPSPREDIILRVVTPERNLGVAGGRNLGMKLATGDVWIFIDDDAVWHDSHDMARFLERFAADPRCGCVAVKVLNPQTGAVDRRLLPSPHKTSLLRATTACETPYFYGCAHAVRADAIARTGMYPERLVYGMEEIDLSFRLIEAGFTIVYDPDIAVLHYEARSGREFVGARYWTQQAVNKSRVAWRQLPLPYPLTICGVWSLATLLKTRQPRAVFAIWRTLWRERRVLSAERKVLSPEALKHLKRVGARLLY